MTRYPEVPNGRRLLHASPLVAGLAAVIVPCATALAQAIEEIVVTATRRPVPALQTPLSIGRVGAEAIGLVGSTHHSELLNRVPGVMIQRGSGQESLTAIRSPVLTGGGSCGAFLFLEVLRGRGHVVNFKIRL